MNIFFIEIKQNIKSLIIWSVGIIFLVVSGMVKFSSFASSSQTANELMSSFPKTVQAIFGISGFDLSKAIGFYGILFLYIAIMAGINAAMLGSGILSKEEQYRTTEFIFVKPVTRNRVITAKLFAGIFSLIILNIVTLAASLAMLSTYALDSSSLKIVATLVVALFILQLLFFFIGTFFASISKSPKTTAALSASTVLLGYFIYVAVGLSDKFDFLKYLSPFLYFDARYIIANSSISLLYLLISFTIIAITLASTYFFYGRRDLNI